MEEINMATVMIGIFKYGLIGIFLLAIFDMILHHYNAKDTRPNVTINPKTGEIRLIPREKKRK